MSTLKKIKVFLQDAKQAFNSRLEPRVFKRIARIESRLAKLNNLNDRAREQGYDFVEKHLHTALLFEEKEDYIRYSVEEALPIPGFIMEFGVFKGKTINSIAKVLQSNKDPRQVFGFDSFEGLSEDWSGIRYPKGSFSLGGKLPKTEGNVTLIKGWVDETFLPFIKEHDVKEHGIAFMHMDMDTYTPTKYVFEQAVPYLTKGSIIIFDEFISQPGWQYHEYKAYVEVIAKIFEHEFIVFNEYSTNAPTMRAGLRILGRKKPARSRSSTPSKKRSRRK